MEVIKRLHCNKFHKTKIGVNFLSEREAELNLLLLCSAATAGNTPCTASCLYRGTRLHYFGFQNRSRKMEDLRES